MPRYIVTLTDDEIQEPKALVQKCGKGLSYQTCTDNSETGSESPKQIVNI